MSEPIEPMEPRENDPVEEPVTPQKPPAPPPPEPAPLPTARAALWKAIEQDCESGGGKATAEELRAGIKTIPTGIAPAGEYRRVSFDLRLKFSDYSARYNAHSGEQISMNFPALADKPGKTMTVDEGVKAARDLLTPPTSAVLEMSEYDEADGAPFFVVLWRHVEAGVPIERDLILGMINGRSKRVFNWQRIWHRLNPSPGPR